MRLRFSIFLIAFAVVLGGGTAFYVQDTSQVAAESCEPDANCPVGLEVGDNSCIGLNACSNAVGPIGDNSCRGELACASAQAEIGRDACRGLRACTSSEGSIGDRSCSGAEFVCNTLSGDVGDDSCNGDEACRGLSGTVADNACNGREACYRLLATVGGNSCNFLEACYSLEGIVGENSCIGREACYSLDGTIGDGSCHGLRACDRLEAIVGNDSCNGEEACFRIRPDGTVGNNSCNGERACRRLVGTVGSNSCNGEEACLEIEDADIGHCELNTVLVLACEGIVLTKTVNGQDEIEVPESGETVIYAVRIVNINQATVYIESLEDAAVAGGDLLSLEGCAAPETGIASDGGVYECTYDVFVSGAAGTSLVNTVTATVSGIEPGDLGTAQAIELTAFATVNFVEDENGEEAADVRFAIVIIDGDAGASDFLFAVNPDVAPGGTVELEAGVYTVSLGGPPEYGVVGASELCSSAGGIVTLVVPAEGGLCIIAVALVDDAGPGNGDEGPSDEELQQIYLTLMAIQAQVNEIANVIANLAAVDIEQRFINALEAELVNALSNELDVSNEVLAELFAELLNQSTNVNELAQDLALTLSDLVDISNALENVNENALANRVALVLGIDLENKVEVENRLENEVRNENEVSNEVDNELNNVLENLNLLENENLNENDNRNEQEQEQTNDQGVNVSTGEVSIRGR